MDCNAQGELSIEQTIYHDIYSTCRVRYTGVVFELGYHIPILR